MKIVLSSQGNKKESLVDVRFGRCNYFAIYNVDKKSFDFVENTGKESNQGAGIAAAQVVLKLNAEALLTERLGPKAFKVLEASSMTLFKCHGMSLEDAVDRFKKNSLTLIEEPYRN